VHQNDRAENHAAILRSWSNRHLSPDALHRGRTQAPACGRIAAAQPPITQAGGPKPPQQISTTTELILLRTSDNVHAVEAPSFRCLMFFEYRSRCSTCGEAKLRYGRVAPVSTNRHLIVFGTFSIGPPDRRTDDANYLLIDGKARVIRRNAGSTSHGMGICGTCQ
jgi:hypothetical protein